MSSSFQSLFSLLTQHLFCLLLLTFVLWCWVVWCFSFHYFVGGSCFSVFSVSVQVVGSCGYISLLLVGVFLASQGLKNSLSLVSFLLAQQVFRFVVLNLADSAQISIILFLYPLCVALKITVKHLFVVFPSPFLSWVFLSSLVACVSEI